MSRLMDFLFSGFVSVILVIAMSALLYNFAKDAWKPLRDDPTFRVLGLFNKDEVWVMPMHVAPMTFRVEAGAMPEKGTLVCSKVETIQREQGGFHYPVVVLTCEGGRKLSLTGIDLK